MINKDIVDGEEKSSSHNFGELIPKDDVKRNEAIMGFYDFASIWNELKNQNSKVSPDVLLRYCLKDHKEWFTSAFFNREKK